LKANDPRFWRDLNNQGGSKLQGLGVWEILGLGFKESHGHFTQNEDDLELGLGLGIKLISVVAYVCEGAFQVKKIK
jgi:hypothetical protein